MTIFDKISTKIAKFRKSPRKSGPDSDRILTNTNYYYLKPFEVIQSISLQTGLWQRITTF